MAIPVRGDVVKLVKDHVPITRGNEYIVTGVGETPSGTIASLSLIESKRPWLKYAFYRAVLVEWVKPTGEHFDIDKPKEEVK